MTRRRKYSDETRRKCIAAREAGVPRTEISRRFGVPVSTLENFFNPKCKPKDPADYAPRASRPVRCVECGSDKGFRHFPLCPLGRGARVDLVECIAVHSD